ILLIIKRAPQGRQASKQSNRVQAKELIGTEAPPVSNMKAECSNSRPRQPRKCCITAIFALPGKQLFTIDRRKLGQSRSRAAQWRPRAPRSAREPRLSQPACIASGFVLPRFVISRFSAET